MFIERKTESFCLIEKTHRSSVDSYILDREQIKFLVHITHETHRNRRENEDYKKQHLEMFFVLVLSVHSLVRYC